MLLELTGKSETLLLSLNQQRRRQVPLQWSFPYELKQRTLQEKNKV